MLRARLPMKLTGALPDDASAPLGPARFLNASEPISRVVLTGVQTASAAAGLFGPYNRHAVLADAAYLPSTLPELANDVLTASDFWEQASDGTGAPLWYEANAAEAFIDVAQDVPGVLVQRGEIAPWITFASAGAVERGRVHGRLSYVFQLAGRSSVLVFPPSALPRLHLFPLMHPRGGQAQAAPGAAGWPWRFPDAWPALRWLTSGWTAAPAAWQAELGPADMLFVPPFWVVQVTHVAGSVQLRLESESIESSMHGDLLTGLDLPASDDVAYQALILRRVIVAVVAHAARAAPSDEAAVAAWLDRHLVAARYLPLYGGLTIATDTNLTLCERNLRGELATAAEDVAAVTEQLVGSVNKRLDSIATLLGSASGPAVRDHMLADYIERLIHFGLGAEDTFPFLALCFATSVPSGVVSRASHLAI